MTDTMLADEAPARRGRKASVNRLGDETAQEAKPVREKRPGMREEVAKGRAVGLDREGNPIYRRRNAVVSQFHVPEELKEAGWDYQWNTVSVLNQEDTARVIADQENGWRPIMADRPGFAGRFMPEGYRGPIQRGGLQLCERPMILSDEARAEDRYNANAMRQQNRQRFGLPDLPHGFEDPQASSFGRFGKGKKAGVNVSLEGAPRADRNYQIDIDNDE